MLISVPEKEDVASLKGSIDSEITTTIGDGELVMTVSDSHSITVVEMTRRTGRNCNEIFRN